MIDNSYHFQLYQRGFGENGVCLEDSKQKKANNLLRFNLVEKRKWWKVERGHNSSHRCFFVTLMRVDFFYGLKDRARPIRYLDGRQLKGNSLGKRKNETFSPNRIIGSLGRWDLTCCVRCLILGCSIWGFRYQVVVSIR